MATVQRKQAPRLARPAARYWKGKAPKGVTEVESDSDVDEGQEFGPQEDGDIQIKDAGDIDIGGAGEEDEDEVVQMRKSKADIKGKSISVALKDVSVSKEGKVIVAGRLESGKTEMEGGEGMSYSEVFRLIESSEEESSEEDEAAGKEESEEEVCQFDFSRKEEEAPKPLFRPVFVPKRARATIAEKEALAEDSEEMQRKREQEAEERRKQSHDMVAESIRRELAEKEKEDEAPDIDDTDDLDPAGEFEAWRLRELGRIKKEKEEELQREQEREEVERRRALPEEQRLKEDLERAEKSRADKPKGQQKFLQKYWHKGAFHQDSEILKRHDFTEATESTVDVSLLPKVMQVKNFGKRGRTKYTHLLDQDTTAGNGGFGGTAPVKFGGTGTETGGCFLCGGPHLKKDCPQNVERTGNTSTTGASRPWKDDRGPRDERPRDDYRNGKDKYKDRDDGYRQRDDVRSRYGRGSKDDRSRDSGRYRDDRRDRYDGYRDRRGYRPSRSRSPPSKDRYRPKERRRSRGRSVDDGYRDKRRRLD
ncbi:Microfibrillar-associated protein 1 [Leucoagaricus sp. SymC.cos]|nr:Microfibrillar-associated protein 1 [Leucoagaricus sp. SymC.cos]